MACWDFRREALLGLAAIATILASGPASAQAPAELRGTWVRPGDPYRTKVRLHIGQANLSAEVGCSVQDYPLVVDDRHFQALGEGGLVIENFCDRCEASAARAYWDEAKLQIVASTAYNLSGDELTLVSPRRVMTFTRAYPRPGGGWIVPGDAKQDIDPAGGRTPNPKRPRHRSDCDALPRRVIP
jgi:hypothetical protein